MTFTLTVKREYAAVEPRLRSQPWVTGLATVSKNGKVRWHIQVSDPEIAEARLVPLALASGGVTVCGFERQTRNLEDIFMHIVEESSHER